MAYPNLNDPQLLKIKTKDDQLKELPYETEKHDYGNSLLKLITNIIGRSIKV